MSLTQTPINKNLGSRVFEVMVSLGNLWWATVGRSYLLSLLVETWHAEQRITWLAAGTCSGFNFLPKFGGREASWGWGIRGTCYLAAGKEQGVPAELLPWAAVREWRCGCVVGGPVGSPGQAWVTESLTAPGEALAVPAHHAACSGR